jgi:ribosome biogenesis GTPase A
MRDYIAPIDLLLKKIPYTILNLFYKMHIIDNDIDGRTFLETFGRYRGYHAGGAHGGYDLNRCSRQVLLDYLSGDLLYIELPECYDNKDKHVNQSNWKFDDTW